MSLRKRIATLLATTLTASVGGFACGQWCVGSLALNGEHLAILLTLLQAGIALVASSAVYFYLDRVLLRPIAGLTRRATAMDLSALEKGAITPLGGAESGPEEVLALTDAINKMIVATTERAENHQRGVAYARAILDAIPGHVFWVSRDLKYLGVNDSLAKAHGVANADFVGKDVGFLDGPRAPLRDFVEHFFDIDEQHAQIELGGDPDDQNSRIFLVSGQKYNSGREAVLVGVDVTDRRRLARQVDLERQRALHASKMSTLGEMAGGIAHEINNPVTIIYGKAKQIQKFRDRPDFQDFATKSAQAIEATAMRIAKIVKGLRTFARDGDKDPFESTPVAGLIDDAVALCEMRLKGRGVDLTIAEVALSLTVECRPTQVSQVLLNLIGNAQDAISALKERWIRVDVIDRGTHVELSVEDSGVGIPEAISARIFNPFYTTKEVGKGTGLGLSISRGIAESHGGKLNLDRSCAHTRFVLVLPKKQPDDAQMRPPPPFFRAS